MCMASLECWQALDLYTVSNAQELCLRCKYCVCCLVLSFMVCSLPACLYAAGGQLYSQLA